MLGEQSGGAELVWCMAELQKLAREDDCCVVVPARCGYCGDVRRLQESATEELVLLEAREGLWSCWPTSAKFCREVQRSPRWRELLLRRRGTGAGCWNQGGAVREQQRGGDSLEHRTDIGKG